MGVDHQAIDLMPEQQRTVVALLGRYLPDTKVWAYGSRVKWTSNPQSDLDLAVFTAPKQRRQVSALREAFDESSLPFSVDLHVWDSLPKNFKQIIEKEHVPLMEKNSFYACGDDWPTATLGDHIQIDDFAYSPKEAWPFINYLDTGSITENRVYEIQYLRPGTDKMPSRARRKVREEDIVYSTIRPNQKHFGHLKKIPDNFLVSTEFAVLRGKSHVCTDFIYWFLSQNRIIEQLHTIAEHSTSAYPSIRPTDIEQLSVKLPPLNEQRAVARILNTLDDKIELNQRMVKTLETMIHALFKSWFIDFDPVRAKMKKQNSGLPRHFAKLFPNKLVNSELGENPEGWEIFCLDELADHHTQSITPANRPKEEFEYYSLSAYTKGKRPLVEQGKNIKSNKIIMPSDSVLLSKLDPQTTRVWIPGVSNDRTQICSTEFMVFTARYPASRSLLSSLFIDVNFQQILRSMATGTYHQRVPSKALKLRKVLPGTAVLFSEFDKLASPMLECIAESRSESDFLTGIRDTLLSKLISGEIQLP